MALNLTKPLRVKTTKESVRFLGLLKNNLHSVVCARTTPDTLTHQSVECVGQYKGDELENVPESKWLNVYETHGGPWYSTRTDAGNGAFHAIDVRIGLLEDKQDGSPFVFHDLRGK